MSKDAIILIVDDAIINRLTLKNLFTDDYTVIEAVDGKEAIDIVKRLGDRISIIITDIIMPNVDGFELIKVIHKDNKLAQIPIIVTTQDGDEETEIQALKLGAEDFITKPYNPLIVRARVINVLSKAYIFNQKLEQNLRENNAINRFNVRHDMLTKLYNQNTFLEETEQMIKKYCQEEFIIASWNINRFQLVNDFFGKTTADEIIIRIANKFHELLYNVGTYARFESDHFFICVRKKDVNINDLLNKIIDSIKDLHVDYDLAIGVGVYEITDYSLTVSQMCNRANIALELTRSKYTSSISYYDESIRNSIIEEQEITNEMTEALANNQFFVQIQPIFSISEGKPISAEGLVRWRHPVKGIISPGKFIPIFEKNGFITKIDMFVWEEACKILKYSKENNYPVVPISVNVSRLNFYNTNLCQVLMDIVNKYDVEPGLLRLEITESAYTDNPYQLVKTIESLKRRGFLILMDDFGSGFSSLNMLKDLPVDILKIDMNFIRELNTSEKAKSILNNIIRLAKWLEMAPIAEGVETIEQVNYLKGIGCDRIQGYYYSRPLDVSDYLKLINKYNDKITKYKHHVTDVNDNLQKIRWLMEESNPVINSIVGAIAIYEMNENGVEVVQVNDIYYQITGSNPKSIFVDNKDILSWIHEDDRKKFIDNCKKVMNEECAISFEFRRYRQDSSIIWLSVKMSHLHSTDTKNLIIAKLTDVTHENIINQDEYIKRYVDPLKNMYDDIYFIDYEDNTILPIKIKLNNNIKTKNNNTFNSVFLSYQKAMISNAADVYNLDYINSNINKFFNTSKKTFSFNARMLFDNNTIDNYFNFIKCEYLLDKKCVLLCIKGHPILNEQPMGNINDHISTLVNIMSEKRNKKKILVVDDSAINRKILSKILSAYYTIYEASNGKEGLDIINKEDDISAIILDIEMPIMNGIEFLKYRQTDDDMMKIPVIVITQNDNKNVEMATLTLGACDFLKKPYENDIVIQRLTNMIKLCETIENDGIIPKFLNDLPIGFGVLKISDVVELVYGNDVLMKNLHGKINNIKDVVESNFETKKIIMDAKKCNGDFIVKVEISNSKYYGKYSYGIGDFSIYYIAQILSD